MPLIVRVSCYIHRLWFLGWPTAYCGMAGILRANCLKQTFSLSEVLAIGEQRTTLSMTVRNSFYSFDMLRNGLWSGNTYQLH
jgi:hypothetical protein